MGLFSNLKSEGLEESQDRLGGGFRAVDSAIYTGPIKALYAGSSKGGATSISVVVDLGEGKEYKETVYITAKPTDEEKAKGLPGKNYFIDKDTKKKMPLPGFTLINDLCLIATEKELSDLDAEEKVIKLWDYEQKKELPTAVKMITEAIGKPVSLGILKVLENKQEKDAQGVYQDTADTKEINQIDKVFHPTMKVTVAEAREGKKEGGFWDAWEKRNKGQLRDKRSIKDGQAPAGAPKAAGSAPAAGAAKKPSLFGGK